MKIIDCIQGSPEWHSARAGRVTASRIADLTARTKTGYGASRANYMAELIAERLTGKVAESFTNTAMQWGTQYEPEARSAYQIITGHEVIPVGFVLHPEIEMAGASPDGLVGTDGLVEIKCPNTSTHIDTLLSEAIPGKYMLQMEWQLICAGRKWCDFVSYDPRLPGRMQLFIKRFNRATPIKPDPLELEVTQFLAEIDSKVAGLSQKFNLKDAA